MPAASSTNAPSAAAPAEQAFFGHALTSTEVRTLVGAPKGATVSARGSASMIHYTWTGGAAHAGAQGDVFIMRGEQNRPVAFINHYPLPSATSHLAWPDIARLTRTQAGAARRLGIDTIGIKLAHFANEHQAYVRMGYDAPIEHAILESYDDRSPPAMRAGARGPRTLLEALRDPAWRAWWDAQGRTPGLSFDTRAGSPSMRQLTRFLRGARRAALPPKTP